MTTQDEEVARLLDFNQSLDIHLLDSFVMIMASGSGHQVGLKPTKHLSKYLTLHILLKHDMIFISSSGYFNG